MKPLSENNFLVPSRLLQPARFIKKLTVKELLHPTTSIVFNVESITLILSKVDKAEGEQIASVFEQSLNILSLTVDAKNVYKIQKSNNHFWQALSKLTKLQSLVINSLNIQITSNDITALSNSISKLKDLRHFELHLEKDIFSTKQIDLSTIVLIERLPQLKTLELSLENNINLNPEFIIISLPAAISKMTLLSSLKLWLRKSNLNDLGVRSLMASIGSLRELHILELGLQNNSISKLGVDFIFEAISKLILLEYVNIQLPSNTINCKDNNCIYPCDFSQLLKIKKVELNFNGNQLLCSGIEVFFKSLSTFKSIPFLELNLKQANYGDIRYWDFENGLSYLQNVLHLILNLDLNEIQEQIKCLSAGLSKLKNLASLELSLGQNNISDHDLAALSSSLSTLIDLKSFTFRNSMDPIKQIGMQHLSNCIAKLVNLEILTLQFFGCEIDDFQIQPLSIAISTLCRLQNLALILNNNKISNNGALMLSMAIEKLSVLSKINLEISMNKIDSRGANILAQGFVQLENLRILKFFHKAAKTIKNNIIKQSRRLIQIKC